ncbi:LacI family transcriptional regulator, partial [Ralstonia solanacearum]
AGETVPPITLPHRLLPGGTLAAAPAEFSGATDSTDSTVFFPTSDTQGASR